MMRHTRQLVSVRSGPRPLRHGFSMVELLVVMGILALLTTVLVFAIGPSLENARISATRVTINQLNDVIQARMDAIQREDLSQEARRLAAQMQDLSANNPTHVAAVEFLLKKQLYRQAFPQRLQDLWGFNLSNNSGTDPSVAPILDDAPAWQAWCNQFDTDLSPPENPTATPAELNSQLLWFALTKISRIRATVGGKTVVLPTLDIGTINTRHVRAPDPPPPDRNPERDPLPSWFVDEWDNSLRFYLWPTRIVQDSTARQSLMPSLQSNDLLLDPDDPFSIHADYWTNSRNLSIGSNTVTAVAFNTANYHDSNVYHVPLIVSAGPDGDLGLEEPTSGSPGWLGVTTNYDAIFDNITNRQR